MTLTHDKATFIRVKFCTNQNETLMKHIVNSDVQEHESPKGSTDRERPF
jgi:hypothetical protein